MSGVTEGEGRHTELPWRVEGPDPFGDYNILHPADSLAVAAVVSNMRPGEVVKANAALIIRAVNAHDDLVAALRAADAFFTKVCDTLDLDDEDTSLNVSAVLRDGSRSPLAKVTLGEIFAQMRAALTKAGAS